MLDDLARIRSIDVQGMLELIYSFPEQCEEAIRLARESIRGVRFHNILNVVVSGLGGSAIGGDMVKMVIAGKVSIPMFINKSYDMPNFVDEKTLVVVSSYSGNTEETLSAFEDALIRKAQIIAVTTGGELKRRAFEHEIPMITIPRGLPPRTALAYSFFSLMVILEEQGIIPKKHFNLDGISDWLRTVCEKFSYKVPEEENEAKQLARKLYNHIPIVYGTCDITDAIALRWKGQVNENAKHPAFWNAFPELDHNEIMGFEGNKELTSKMFVVILRSPEESERIKKRIDITIDLIQGKTGGIVQIWPEGSSHIERVFYHILLGDYMSTYLAILNEKDPTDIGLMDTLKERMQEAYALNKFE